MNDTDRSENPAAPAAPGVGALLAFVFEQKATQYGTAISLWMIASLIAPSHSWPTTIALILAGLAGSIFGATACHKANVRGEPRAGKPPSASNPN